MKLSERVAELEAKVKKLEEELAKLETRFIDHKTQTQYQLSKDARYAREMGKKR
jgi:cell division protein FtsB